MSLKNNRIFDPVFVRSLVPVLLVLLAAASTKAQDWSALTGPFAGSIRSAGVSPRSGLLFAATVNGGVYRSADHGESWTRVSTWVESARIVLAIDQEGRILVGTDGQGVYHSSDDGASWARLDEPGSLTGLPPDLTVEALTVAPDGALLLGAGGSRRGLFRSTDHGEHWKEIEALQGASVISLLATPQGVILAGTELPGSGSPALRRSIDGGATWVKVDSGSAVLSLARDSAGRLFAGTRRGGVFRSTDGGIGWERIGGDEFVSDYVSVAAGRSGELFVGTDRIGLLRSGDGGATWTQIATGVRHPYVWPVLSDMDGRLYAGSDWGATFRATSATGAWRRVGLGLFRSSLHRAIALPAAGRIVAGTSDGVVQSRDGGKTWEQGIRGLTSLDVHAVASTSSGSLVAGGPGGGVHRSADGGANWVVSRAAGSEESISAILAVGEGIVLAAGGGKVLRSNDDGIAWSESQVGLPTGFSAVSLAAGTGGAILLGTAGQGAFRSADTGRTWTAIPGLEGRTIRSLGPWSDGIILAATEQGAYRWSAISGVWELASKGLADGDVRSLSLAEGQAFVATYSGGIHRTRDAGATWTRVGNGMETRKTLAVAADQAGSLYAIALGEGLFRIAIPARPQAPALVSAAAEGGAIRLTWMRGNDMRVAGWRVWAGLHPDSLSPRRTAGPGDTTTLFEAPAPGQVVHFRLTAVDSSGDESEPSGMLSAKVEIPTGIGSAAPGFEGVVGVGQALHGGRIRIALARPGLVEIEIYDARGARISKPEIGYRPAGIATAAWRSRSTGAVFYRLTIRDASDDAPRRMEYGRIAMWR